MKEGYLKGILSIAIAGIMAYFEKLIIPIAVLIVFMILDYFTGMAAAWLKKELNSRIGILGIIKKVCYLVTICVAMGVDYLICVGMKQIGINFDLSYMVGMIVTIWLIINEMISILENTAKISGKNPPALLQNLLDRLKNTVDKTGDKE